MHLHGGDPGRNEHACRGRCGDGSAMERLGGRSTRIVVKKKRQSGELVFGGPQSGARDGGGAVARSWEGRVGQRLWAVDLPELGTTLAELSGGDGAKCVVPNSLENAARFPQIHSPGRACSFAQERMLEAA